MREVEHFLLGKPVGRREAIALGVVSLVGLTVADKLLIDDLTPPSQCTEMLISYSRLLRRSVDRCLRWEEDPAQIDLSDISSPTQKQAGLTKKLDADP